MNIEKLKEFIEKAKNFIVDFYAENKSIVTYYCSNLKTELILSCLKTKFFVEEIYNKIDKAIKQRKLLGRPLIIEYPLYVVKEAVIGFIDGAKRGIRLCRIKREQLNTEV